MSIQETYLQDIANAIREKEGSSGSIPANTFADRIRALNVLLPVEAYTWDEISEIAKAGKASAYWNVGDKKNIKVNDVTYVAQIIGFDHDEVTDPKAYGRDKAGTSWQLVDCLSTTYKMENTNTNKNGWSGCLMRNSTMPLLKRQLEESLQNVIVKVKKKASKGNQSSDIETVDDDLFLLCEEEIFGEAKYAKPGQGTQYAFYADGNSTIKKHNGTAYYWWGRSPVGSSTTTFCYVDISGSDGTFYASANIGIPFGFCV